MEENFIRNRA